MGTHSCLTDAKKSAAKKKKKCFLGKTQKQMTEKKISVQISLLYGKYFQYSYHIVCTMQSTF